MRIFFNGLVLGLLLGGGLGWFASKQWQRPSPANDRFQQEAKQEATRAVDAAGEALFRAGEALRAKAEVLNLKPDQIKEELARAGKVVRRQSRELAGQAADATVDAATTAAVKARLAADAELSVWTIGVSTTAGHVTLDGTVNSEDHIARAITLALETAGVAQVTANLKVGPKQ
jgi:osmotically-inducible protein OsmY